MRYVALLRGINVGGSHLVPMAALKSCFEQQRLRDVSTYIQSGNVIFTAGHTDSEELTRRLERALARMFGFAIPVVTRSADEICRVVERAPMGFGADPDTHRYDVFFLKSPVTVDEGMKGVTTTPGVDRVWPGEGVVYFSRLIARAKESQISRIMTRPVYRSMTIRNWNTTRKLSQLVAGTD
jgi:uncharacterized protein (DUF1697 family)